MNRSDVAKDTESSNDKYGVMNSGQCVEMCPNNCTHSIVKLLVLLLWNTVKIKSIKAAERFIEDRTSFINSGSAKTVSGSKY